MAAATGKFLRVMNDVKAIASNLVAVDATDGIKFDCKNYPNERILFIVVNTEAANAKDVTLCKPTTGSYAAADADVKLEDLAAGAEAVIFAETARFANNDGSIIIKGESANVKAVAIVLG